MMKLKFVKALLEVCETPDEIDEVFDMAGYDMFTDRCALLIERDCKYFDLPKEPAAQYEALKIMYTNSSSRMHRKIQNAKDIINEAL